MDLYLIDAKQLISEVNNSLEDNHEHLHFLPMISQQPIIDPETLPIVQELREHLAKVTAERDELKKNVGRL